MSETDEEWTRRIWEAAARAREQGRGDVVEYLALRQTNDEARRAGIALLLDSFMRAVAIVNRAGAGLNLERTDNHKFKVGTATMVGERIAFRYGVRALSIEVGYPRAPGDGIITGGGLACALIKHFGQPKLDTKLLLRRTSDAALHWMQIGDLKRESIFSDKSTEQHVLRLLDDK